MEDYFLFQLGDFLVPAVHFQVFAILRQFRQVMEKMELFEVKKENSGFVGGRAMSQETAATR